MIHISDGHGIGIIGDSMCPPGEKDIGHMIVGVLDIELYIPNSNSLKAKRFAIKSLKDRLKHRFNIAVAETAHTDKWQRATLGVAAVSNDTKHVENILDKVMNHIYSDYRVEVIRSTRIFY